MTPQQVVSALRAIRYAPKQLSLNELAFAAGISHMAAYRAARTGRISDKHAASLARALEMLTKRAVSETPSSGHL